MTDIVAYKLSIESEMVRAISTDGLDIVNDNAEYIIREIIKAYDKNKVAVVWDTAEDFMKPLFSLLPEHIVTDLKRGIGANFNRMRLWWGITRWARAVGLRADFREQIKDNLYNEERREINIGELKQYFDWITENQTLEKTFELGNKLINTFNNMGLTQINNLTSAISVFKDSVLDKMEIPTIFTTPDEVMDAHEYAYNSIDEWDKLYIRGDVSPIYQYDISNAYGSALAELPDLNDCDILHSDTIMDGCVWGYLRRLFII
jgi:hypothetical protein